MEDQTRAQIATLRGEIDKIDANWLQLLLKRADCIQQIGALKRHSGKPVRDTERELSQIHQIKKACDDAGRPELLPYVLLVQRVIVEGSVRLQGNSDAVIHGVKYCMFCEWTTSGVTEPPLNWPTCIRCHMPLIITAR